jgi:hypothetical protein
VAVGIFLIFMVSVELIQIFVSFKRYFASPENLMQGIILVGRNFQGRCHKTEKKKKKNETKYYSDSVALLKTCIWIITSKILRASR